MESTPLRRAYLAIEPTGNEHGDNHDAFSVGGGQAQIHAADGEWTLHLLGDPANWRHLALVIQAAADEVEALAKGDAA